MKNVKTTIINRKGQKEDLCIVKIINRLTELRNRVPILHNVDVDQLGLETIKSVENNISTTQIDNYSAKVAETMSINNPQYFTMAARIITDSHHKNTLELFKDKLHMAYDYVNKDGVRLTFIQDTFYQFVEKNSNKIQEMIDYNRDYLIGYYGMCIFLHQFGIKINGHTIERPQDMYMRIAIYLNLQQEETDIDIIFGKIKKTYDALSLRKYTHSSSTFYNAGTINSQMASCFLLGIEDSTPGIMHLISNCAKISRLSGGIGLHIGNIRSHGSQIRSIIDGRSNGPLPFIKMMESTMKAFNQGGKRPGSAAIYVPIWHADIEAIIDLRLPNGDIEQRARSLYYAVWVPNLFMKRLGTKGARWSLFNPDKVMQITGKSLTDFYDDDYTKDYAFTKFYTELEDMKLFDSQIDPHDLLYHIYTVNKLTGIPYICFSDHANTMSNYKHIGVIKSSNLCTEIYQYSDSQEYAVCTLCSISLTEMVKDASGSNNEFPEAPYFDFDDLRETVRICITNLNTMIDKNLYPCPETERGSLLHRPVGLGVQGLADVFLKMRYKFTSEEAKTLNKHIFETIYYTALAHSVNMSVEKRKEYMAEIKEKGSVTVLVRNPDSKSSQFLIPKTYNSAKELPKTIGAFPTFDGSPLSKGIFHWELYGLKPQDLWQLEAETKYDWESLRGKLQLYGCRNIVMTSLQPTVATSQLLNNNEACEPYTSNIYTRSTKVADLLLINKYLTNDLFRFNIWNNHVKDCLIASQGSVQCIDGIPAELKELYMTAYEIDQAEIIQQAIDRAPFIDQGQSTNWFVEDLNYNLFCKLIVKAYLGKLKTAKYYVHTQPATTAQKFTIHPDLQKEMEQKIMLERLNRQKLQMIEKKNTQVCDACSS